MAFYIRFPNYLNKKSQIAGNSRKRLILGHTGKVLHSNNIERNIQGGPWMDSPEEFGKNRSTTSTLISKGLLAD